MESRYARVCVIFSHRSATGATSKYVLVKYFKEEPDSLGTIMPRVTWAVRQRQGRRVNWYDVVAYESILRPVFLQRDYTAGRPKGRAFFVNVFV